MMLPKPSSKVSGRVYMIWSAEPSVLMGVSWHAIVAVTILTRLYLRQLLKGGKKEGDNARRSMRRLRFPSRNDSAARPIALCNKGAPRAESKVHRRYITGVYVQ